MQRVITPLGFSVFLVAAGFAQVADAANAVYIPGYAIVNSYSGGSLELQGSTGRIDVPLSFQGAAIDQSKILTVGGATANDSVVYTLLTSASPSTGSMLLLSDPHTGSILSTVSLDTQLSDIAYTNGQLYGISNKSNALQIDTVDPSGTTHSVLNQAVASSNATWRLSGVAGGSGLLAARGSFSSTDVPGFVINPSSLAVSSITLAGTKNSQLVDTVINAPGNVATSVGIGALQTATAYPAGGSLGAVPSNAQYGTSFGSNAVSDEFNYTYSPALPAAVQINWNANVSPIQGLTDGLTRTAQVVTVSGPVQVTNHVAPDATTLSNVAATTHVQEFFGSASFTSSVQDAAPGDFSDRTIGQASATLDLATGGRGLYAITSSTSMTADYAHDSTVDTGRTVQTPSATAVTQFAYEPVSDNLVGNGDAAMNGAGWQGTLNGTFISEAVMSDPSNHRFYVAAFASQAGAMRQTLQLPTPNSPMQLSFTYGLQSLPAHSDELQVFLNSVLVADVTPTSTTTQTFQTTIDNPALENLANPVLLIQGTSTSQLGDLIYVGNISLTSVPEPMVGLILPVLCMLCSQRRQRRAS